MPGTVHFLSKTKPADDAPVSRGDRFQAANCAEGTTDVGGPECAGIAVTYTAVACKATIVPQDGLETSYRTVAPSHSTIEIDNRHNSCHYALNVAAAGLPTKGIWTSPVAKQAMR